MTYVQGASLALGIAGLIVVALFIYLNGDW